MIKKALITGITGQDGSYLADFLLKKGYEVHGMKRRSSLLILSVLIIFIKTHMNLIQILFYIYGDLADSLVLSNIIQKVQPDEIYNLAAQSHVSVSFESPEYTAE